MAAIDTLIGWMSPERALKRARARLALKVVEDHAKRRYEGAAKSRRTTGWKAPASSANAETLSDLATLRNRHRDLVRNNPWARRAVNCIATNTVGYGIEAAIRSRSKVRATRLQNLWKQWSGGFECDAEGCHNLAGLQSQIMRTVPESGEALVLRVRRPSSSGLTVPLQIRVLEPDQLDSLRNGATAGGGRIIQGIEYDKSGQRVAYWLYTSHPGDPLSLPSRQDVQRVDAKDVAHVYIADRPGQARGVPWGASVLLKMRDLDDYSDAFLLRQKLANCFTAFVEDSDLAPGATGSTTPLTETLEPGAIEILPNGKKVTFSNPPPAGDYGKFNSDNLYAIASAYGITFEALTGNLVNVSFTSGRMGWLEMQRNIEYWRWQMLIPQGLARISDWFLEAAGMMGERVDDAIFSWTPPKRELIDPPREVPPMIKAMRAGVTSLKETHRELGYDTEQVLAEIAEVNEMADKLGLVLDTDPRKVSISGGAQSRPFDESGGTDETTET